VAFLRSGDQDLLRAALKEKGLIVKDHEAGYRSVHYVLSSNLTQTKIGVEVQVRTIFEEGWSEIDHRVRYPNFPSSPQVAYFLDIFNRTAGSADEMGSFVKILAEAFNEAEQSAARLTRERDDAVAEMQSILEKLSHVQQRQEEREASIADLKKQVNRLSQSSARAVDLNKLLSLATTSDNLITRLNRSNVSDQVGLSDASTNNLMKIIKSVTEANKNKS
jgi:putative GTP pyrophosphokinase